MADENSAPASTSAFKLLFYWAVVGAPLAWGIYTTLLKLPALFK